MTEFHWKILLNPTQVNNKQKQIALFQCLVMCLGKFCISQIIEEKDEAKDFKDGCKQLYY